MLILSTDTVSKLLHYKCFNIHEFALERVGLLENPSRGDIFFYVRKRQDQKNSLLIFFGHNYHQKWKVEDIATLKW